MIGKLADMMSFLNGDNSQNVLQHYCLQGHGPHNCCNSDDEALCKLLSHLVPFWARGYNTPLLYRMKHYGPASSFMKLGCCWFGILPQIMREVQATKASNDTELAALVDTFLGASGEYPIADFNHLLADALDADDNYAAKNGARLKMVVQEITSPGFGQSSMIIDALISPMERGVNFLLGHTKTHHDLCYVGRGHDKHEALRKQSKDKFLEVVSGKLGRKIMQYYLAFLENGLEEAVDMGLQNDPKTLSKIFSLALICISDVFRRFVLEFTLPPWSLFQFVDFCMPEFLTSWADLEGKFQKCRFCVDSQMTATLLRKFPDLGLQTLQSQEQAKCEIQGILGDISEFAAITSDVVELKNGQTQWSVSKRGRQHVLNPRSAAENTLLQSAVKQHAWVTDIVSSKTLPTKRVSSGIYKMAGVSSTNQHTNAEP